MDFSGKRVLVVGGSSGIGNAIARSFLRAGANVTVWGTRPTARDYAGEDGSDLSKLHYACVNVACREILDRAPHESPLDVLVLCQGTIVYGRGEFRREGWDKVVSVNLQSVMDCAMKFKPALMQAQGTLVVVSSVSGFRANKGNPAYAASKAGAVSLTRTLAEAWAADGIRVNGIAPGLIDTKLTKATVGVPHRRDAALAAIPLARCGTAEEVAAATLFLASSLASYIIGHTLVVDGGLTLS